MELKNGFLDDNMEILIKDIKKIYHKELEIIYLYNRFLDKIIFFFDGMTLESGKDEYIIASLVQFHKLFQASVILLKNGLATEFESMLRKMIELEIHVLYVLKDENNYQRICLSEEYERRSLLNYIKEVKSYELVPKDKVEEYIEESNKRINNFKTKKVIKKESIKEICKNLELTELYVCYKHLCGYVHENMKSIYNSIIIENETITIDTNPKWDDFNNKVNRLINIVDIIINKIIIKYKLDLNKELEELYEDARKI